MAEIHLIPTREDNYIFLIQEGGHAVVVDPADAPPVLSFLEEHGLTLDAVWNTHHHGDHVGGNTELVAATGCAVLGYVEDAARITAITHHLNDGEVFEWMGHEVQVIAVPGHTLGHIAYYSEALRAVFVGDTIFSAGCGRLFEGSPEMMHESISRLKALPDETRLYCAHEYTLSNLKFARSVEPENEVALWQELRAKKLRQQNRPTIPTTISLEKAMNPFLRTDSEEIRKMLGLEGANDADVFAELRKRKDQFNA